MANEIFVNEGLAYLLGILPKGGTSPTTLYLGLFTSQTASTTPAASAVLGASPSGITEATYTSYARVAVASTDWGSVTSNDTVWGQTGVSSVAASQKSFPAATASYSTAINGFFLASASTQGTLIYASNFDDTTAIATMAIGDIIKITPKYALGA
jgi:hypothetical protein